jgi:hypothetical protein
MIRSRRWLVVLFFLAALAGGRLAGADEPAKKPAEKKWLVDRAVTISPQAEPRPALKYRLLPSLSERKPGNAVPIYLRLVHEQNDASRRRWVDLPTKWNNLPLDRLPLVEARKFLKDRAYMLRQLELGARREKAEWEYTLDAGDPIGLLLPDVQNMRGYVPLLVLQVRVAMAEKDHAAAVRHLETAFGFSQHVAEAPFLISSLVAVATSSIFFDTVTEFVEQPDAPNLYWALTALPRPLVRMRKSMDFERAMMKLQFPDLADLDRARPAEEWDEVLKRVRKEWQRLAAFDRNPKPPPAGTTADDPASKSPDLATARKYLTEQRGLPAERVKAMPDAQVLVLWMASTFDDFADDCFKTASLPYLKAQPLLAAAAKRLKAAPDNEGHRLAKWLLPAVNKVRDAQNRLDRRIAALRVIEALRLHAAANSGKLPDNLSDVTVVPVPNDPGTGKPFDYKSDSAKGTATLTGTIPNRPPELTGLRYQLTVRAKGGA